MNGAASAALAQFTEALGQAMNEGKCDGMKLLPDLKDVLTAQESLDYLRVADLLEYRVGPNL
jgi:hypothetical protein